MVCAALFCLSDLARAGALPREDTAWKNYYSPQGGYCVDYLSRWVSGYAFEGVGFFLKPPANAHSRSLAEIDVAVLDQRDGLTLADEVQLHIDGLRKFELAERIQLRGQHEAQLSGGPALFSADTYFDPQNKTMVDDEMVVANHGGKLYRLELTTDSDGLKRFEPTFQRMLNSFRFDCPPHAVPRDFPASLARKPNPVTITRPAVIPPRAAAN
jgi:hypothetical protein